MASTNGHLKTRNIEPSLEASEMNIGDRVELEGITQKGKNRIRENGRFWNIVNKTSDNQFLFSSESSDYLKWGPAPDFKIKEI